MCRPGNICSNLLKIRKHRKIKYMFFQLLEASFITLHLLSASLKLQKAYIRSQK